MRPSPTRLLAAALAALLLGACATPATKSAKRYSRADAARPLAQLETVGLELGTFSVEGASCVLDGDTLRIKGLQNTVRLLNVDAEEVFKKDFERKAYAMGWDAYKQKMRGDSPRPVKMPTPLGEEAKRWAQEFIGDSTQVRLERDAPGEIRDFYGRYLAYVFVAKDGHWLNFNVEAVRAGMSPYYTKYGFSRRYHREFEQAQAQAQAAKVGIWDPMKRHYEDYEERLAWWDQRARFLAAFEADAEKDPARFVSISSWNALTRLEDMVGQEVEVIGPVRELRMGDTGPTVVKLSRSRGVDFDVVFFDKDVYLASGIAAANGEFVRVKGRVNKYLNKRRNQEQLQIIVGLPGQVLTPDPKLDQLLAPAPRAAPAAGPDVRAVEATEVKTQGGPAQPPLPPLPMPAAEPAGEEAGGTDAEAEGDEYKDLKFDGLD